jgi:Zn ribbon nucleic-acid-binding protein
MHHATLEGLLVEAMIGARCPVCSVVESLLFDELCQLQREAVVDPLTQADVVARGGYCAAHFWYLDELASPVTTAELLAPLIDRGAERLTGLADELHAHPVLLRHGAPQMAIRLGVPPACRLCERVAVWQTDAIETLLAVIADPDRHRQYTRGSGLCLPHLTEALTLYADPAAAESMLRIATDQWRRLAADLREYVRKWKAKDRTWGSADAAPGCAVEKLAGAKRSGRTR